jgi:formylglycine-generating enzyme required for sulfatase activity
MMNNVACSFSPFEASGSQRVIRGGSYYGEGEVRLRTDFRTEFNPSARSGQIGFHLARSKPR